MGIYYSYNIIIHIGIPYLLKNQEKEENYPKNKV